MVADSCWLCGQQPCLAIYIPLKNHYQLHAGYGLASRQTIWLHAKPLFEVENGCWLYSQPALLSCLHTTEKPLPASRRLWFGFTPNHLASRQTIVASRQTIVALRQTIGWWATEILYKLRCLTRNVISFITAVYVIISFTTLQRCPTSVTFAIRSLCQILMYNDIKETFIN